MRIAALLFVVVGCYRDAPAPTTPTNKKAEKPARPARPPRPAQRFHCDKAPSAFAGVRVCNLEEDSCTDAHPCFEVAKAGCYVRSEADFANDQWSATETTVSCFATVAECETDRKGVGTWGPPPIDHPCREMEPDEAAGSPTE